MALTQGSLEVNGSAGQVTDVKAPSFYIGLHAGLFIHTADRLLRVLADPKSLPEVGNVELDQQGRTGTLLGVIPNDPSRRQSAIDLTTLALTAVFAHEVGHIVRGHLRLLRTRFGVSRLYEVGTPNADSPSEMRQQSLRRAMELDADIFAGKFLGTLLFNTKSSGWYNAFGNDKRDLLRMLALSTACTFRAFDDQSSSTYYHTPFMRAQLLTMSAKRMARQDIPFELDDFRKSAWLPEILNVLRSPRRNPTPLPARNDESTASTVPLKWANDKATGAPRYIHDPEVVGRTGTWICATCELELTPVLAGQPMHVRPTAHFRHPAGAQRDACVLVAACAAAVRHLAERGFIDLPRRTMSATAQGFSGQDYEVWVGEPAERVRVSSARTCPDRCA